MDLKIYPNKSSIQDFHVHGFVVLSFRDEILTDDNKFAPVQFFEPRIFSTVDQAQSHIDSNGLSQKGFFVWKMFDCYGCRGYSNLDSDDESLKKFMDDEKENILMFSDFDDF